MRIKQGYVSKSVSDFPFLKALKLTGYIDSERPLVVFGVYSQADMDVIINHKSKVIVVWCGQDAIDCIFFGRHQYLKEVMHVTWLSNVYRALKSFLHIRLISPVFLGGEFEPSILGSKIFVYSPSTYPEYHQYNLVLELMHTYPNIDFVVGNGLIPQHKWLSGHGSTVYSDCFIGLCLSGFAGGGQTIMQMGLKGIPVVTNVLELPNTREWHSIDCITNFIDSEMENIGTINYKLSNAVELQLKKDEIWMEV